MLASNVIRVLLSTIATLAVVDSHGYTTVSRNFLCVDGRNFQCGSIVYEPQSLEAPKGFPGAGPSDGQIASAGIGRFNGLDEQSRDRWLKTNVQAGTGLDFTWKFTANHRTTGFEYFITKDNWNPDMPLSRAQFDLNPFCAVPFGGAKPKFDGETHSCTLPSTKEGYHVILAIWVIDDTAAAFYNMNDVNFGGTNPPVATIPTSPAPTEAPVLSPTNPTANPPPASAPTAPGALCSSGLPLEAIDSCRGFVFCDNGSVIPGSEKPCASGLLFNEIAQICDWDYNVLACGGNTPDAPPVSPPTEAPVAVTQAPVPVPTNNPPTPGGLCSSGQPLEPVDGCTGFVYCVGGKLVQNSKVNCASGLLFSSALLFCDWASNVDCN